MTDHILKHRIKALILQEWPGLPPEFYGHTLFNRVNVQILKETDGEKHPYPDTILRYLRELREERKLNYEVAKRISLYMKMP